MGVQVGDRVRVSADYLAGWTRGGITVPDGLDRVCIVRRTYPPGHDFHEYAQVATDKQVCYYIPEGSLQPEHPEVAQLEDAIEKISTSNDALRRLTEQGGS